MSLAQSCKVQLTKITRAFGYLFTRGPSPSLCSSSHGWTVVLKSSLTSQIILNSDHCMLSEKVLSVIKLIPRYVIIFVCIQRDAGYA